MLAAEIASTTAKPSMILARNRKVGSLKGEPSRFRNRTSTPRFRSENQALEAPAPNPVRKLKAEWIRPRKCGQKRQGAGSVLADPLQRPSGEVKESSNRESVYARERMSSQ